jgi:hypothetical protein
MFACNQLPFRPQTCMYLRSIILLFIFHHHQRPRRPHRRPRRVASGLIGGACATTSLPSSTTRTRRFSATKSTSSFSRSPAARSSRGMEMRRCWPRIWASSRPSSGAEKWGFFFVFVLFFRGQFWELFSHFEQSSSLAVSVHALSYLRF